MDDTASAAALLDTFLRLSRIEGFTAGHLRRLRTRGAAGRLTGTHFPESRSLLARAEAALSSPETAGEAEAIRDRCSRDRIAILAFGFPGYPALLREIPDPPLILYRAGGAFPEDPAVAIVGSRAPTGPGKEFARQLSGGLAAAGWTVVSGMARGIDAAAHAGALRAGGVTVAVLGCGVDVVYPPENGRLRAEILEGGAILSEYPPGSLPLPHRFPARNRVVSGICRGVVVAEAAERSGALITARAALEQGREVLAVPGSPWFAHTAGSNRLLREGAAPACSAADVLDLLGGAGARVSTPLLQEVLSVLSGECSAARISATLRLPLPEVLSCLAEMEVANLVEKRTGGYYKKKSERPGPTPGVSQEGEWPGR